jgi:hypothetical protein
MRAAHYKQTVTYIYVYGYVYMFLDIHISRANSYELARVVSDQVRLSKRERVDSYRICHARKMLMLRDLIAFPALG